jgi:DNA-binding beta-propeller fold protein YncE
MAHTGRTVLALLLAACGDPAPAEPTTPLLLVANTTESTLSILALPAGNELVRLATGTGPHEVAVSPDRRRAVVSNYGDSTEAGHSLTVIDLASLAVVRTIELDPYGRPHGIAFVDARCVVVTSEASAAVVVVDLDTGTIDRAIPTTQRGSHMLAIAPGASRVYVANLTSGSITPIDLANAEAGEPVPAIPENEAIAVTPDGAQVWTASVAQNRIRIFDAPQLTLDGELGATGAPIRITPTPDGTAMIVSNASAGNLQLIDVATRAISTIDLVPASGGSATPVGAAVASDSRTAYVALVAENRVAVVDLAARTTTASLAVGQGPDGVAYRPLGATP